MPSPEDMDPAATIAATPVPEPHPDWHPVWTAFSQAYDECVGWESSAANEEDFRRELVFCLLGGHGVTYELSLSALKEVDRLKIFAPHWTREELHKALACELVRPQFKPLRKDGSLRRYRFPHRKASLIAAAREWVLAQGTITSLLELIPDERHRRDLLCDCPGLGPKSASWLLRNTGYAANLAILDIHVVRAMNEHGRIGAELIVSRDYESIEAEFLTWCDELGARPNALDLFLWEWQRGTLRADPPTV